MFGAGGGTRTHTPLLTTDFESVSSANSDTPASNKIYYTIAYRKNQEKFYLFIKILGKLFC